MNQIMREIVLRLQVCTIVVSLTVLNCFAPAGAQDGKQHSYASSVSGQKGTSYANSRGASSTSYAGPGGGAPGTLPNYSSGGYSGNNSYSMSSQGVPSGSYARSVQDLSPQQQHIHLGKSTGGSLLGIMRGRSNTSARPAGLMGRMKINAANAVPARVSVGPSMARPAALLQRQSASTSTATTAAPTAGKAPQPPTQAQPEPPSTGPSLLKQLHKKRP